MLVTSNLVEYIAKDYLVELLNRLVWQGRLYCINGQQASPSDKGSATRQTKTPYPLKNLYMIGYMVIRSPVYVYRPETIVLF